VESTLSEVQKTCNRTQSCHQIVIPFFPQSFAKNWHLDLYSEATHTWMKEIEITRVRSAVPNSKKQNFQLFLFQSSLTFLLYLFIYLFIGSTEVWTQGLVHIRYVLCMVLLLFVLFCFVGFSCFSDSVSLLSWAGLGLISSSIRWNYRKLPPQPACSLR
jgi:hypothetical protein